jgi:hypothetical protein
VDLDLTKLLAWAHQFRWELRETEYQAKIDHLAINLSEAERFPVVAFGAAYGLSNTRFPLRTEEWNTTLNLSLPLFNGFSSRARIRQKRIRADQSRIQRTELEDKINQEVRDGYADLLYWQKELEERQREFSAIKIPFPYTPTALETAQRSEWYLQASDSYREAVHGHCLARAKLEQLVGRPLIER